MPRKQSSTALALRIDALAELYGEPEAAIPKTPLSWILWENVAYLVDDEKRALAFAALAKHAGLTAEKIERASAEKLLAATRLGGMHPEARVDRLKDIAALALEHGGKGLESVSKLPLPAARKVLEKFPSIGAPGADKILLACGLSNTLALESNGLRVLARLGYGTEAKDYAATYRSVLSGVAGEVVDDADWAWRAHRLLRAHGQTLCKRTSPDCAACPLARNCAYARGAVT